MSEKTLWQMGLDNHPSQLGRLQQQLRREATELEAVTVQLIREYLGHKERRSDSEHAIRELYATVVHRRNMLKLSKEMWAAPTQTRSDILTRAAKVKGEPCSAVVAESSTDSAEPTGREHTTIDVAMTTEK